MASPEIDAEVQSVLRGQRLMHEVSFEAQYYVNQALGGQQLASHFLEEQAAEQKIQEQVRQGIPEATARGIAAEQEFKAKAMAAGYPAEGVPAGTAMKFTPLEAYETIQRGAQTQAGQAIIAKSQVAAGLPPMKFTPLEAYETIQRGAQTQAGQAIIASLKPKTPEDMITIYQRNYIPDEKYKQLYAIAENQDKLTYLMSKGMDETTARAYLYQNGVNAVDYAQWEHNNLLQVGKKGGGTYKQQLENAMTDVRSGNFNTAMSKISFIVGKENFKRILGTNIRKDEKGNETYDVAIYSEKQQIPAKIAPYAIASTPEGVFAPRPIEKMGDEEKITVILPTKPTIGGAFGALPSITGGETIMTVGEYKSYLLHQEGLRKIEAEKQAKEIYSFSQMPQGKVYEVSSTPETEFEKAAAALYPVGGATIQREVSAPSLEYLTAGVLAGKTYGATYQKIEEKAPPSAGAEFVERAERRFEEIGIPYLAAAPTTHIAPNLQLIKDEPLIIEGQKVPFVYMAKYGKGIIQFPEQLREAAPAFEGIKVPVVVPYVPMISEFFVEKGMGMEVIKTPVPIVGSAAYSAAPIKSAVEVGADISAMPKQFYFMGANVVGRVVDIHAGNKAAIEEQNQRVIQGEIEALQSPKFWTNIAVMTMIVGAAIPKTATIKPSGLIKPSARIIGEIDANIIAKLTAPEGQTGILVSKGITKVKVRPTIAGIEIPAKEITQRYALEGEYAFKQPSRTFLSFELKKQPMIGAAELTGKEAIRPIIETKLTKSTKPLKDLTLSDMLKPTQAEEWQKPPSMPMEAAEVPPTKPLTVDIIATSGKIEAKARSIVSPAYERMGEYGLKEPVRRIRGEVEIEGKKQPLFGVEKDIYSVLTEEGHPKTVYTIERKLPLRKTKFVASLTDLTEKTLGVAEKPLKSVKEIYMPRPLSIKGLEYADIVSGKRILPKKSGAKLKFKIPKEELPYEKWIKSEEAKETFVDLGKRGTMQRTTQRAQISGKTAIQKAISEQLVKKAVASAEEEGFEIQIPKQIGQIKNIASVLGVGKERYAPMQGIQKEMKKIQTRQINMQKIVSAQTTTPLTRQTSATIEKTLQKELQSVRTAQTMKTIQPQTQLERIVSLTRTTSIFKPPDIPIPPPEIITTGGGGGGGIPPVPPLGGGEGGMFGRGRPSKRKKGYLPDVAAIMLGITAKKAPRMPTLTGTGIRPMIVFGSSRQPKQRKMQSFNDMLKPYRAQRRKKR